MNDGFKVVERIGGGEFVDIWTGVHQATNTNVNIQIVDRKKLGNALDIDRINALCEPVITLNHPNVLKYFKVVSNDKNIAIVTEPIQGRSLRDYLVEKNNKRIPEAEARMIIRQIVEGVSYLHAQNIAHRNLTLHNIYIHQGEIKLGNLLICTKHTDMCKPITNQKSDCHFFAPEVWESQNTTPDCSCDLWSIGVILYVLVCGCYPFDGKNEICIFISARHARFMIPNFITAECSSLIRQLLQPMKEARMKLSQFTCNPWYNNLSAPMVRQSSQNNFGYSLHSIPESLNENEEVKQQQEPQMNVTDFINYPFISLDLPNSGMPLFEEPISDANNNNNNTNSPAQPRRRKSYSTPSSPQPPTLEEFTAEQSGTKVMKVPSRKRSADQEQILAMMQNRSGSFGLDDSNITLGTTPPQPRKRTSSVSETKEILNLLEVPPMESELNNLSYDLEKLQTTEDPGSYPNSPSTKSRGRKKSDPSSPKSTTKKGNRRTYRRRSLDDFSHLVGPNTNPDLPTYNQVFQEPPRESSFGFPQNLPQQVPTMVPRSPSTQQQHQQPVYSGLNPNPRSPSTSMPISPVIFPAEMAALAFMESQFPHGTPPDLPVQPPKISPLVFYSPDIAQDAQFLGIQSPFMQGGVYPPPQNSHFDIPPQFFPVTDTETLNLAIDTITPKHVSNFVGSVIPETEEEWANNVVNRKYS